MFGSLSLNVKTSGACNMACRYCDADIYSRKRISFQVLAHLVTKALKTGADVQFIWHGGEPLLLGKEFYRKAVGLQQRCKLPQQRVINLLQTNGTLLDEGWLDFFDEAGFNIGLSLDGPAQLHDKNRVLGKGHGSFHKVMRAARLMKERNREFGVLAVVTEDTIRLGAKELFRFFVDNGLKKFGLLCQHPAINVGRTEYISRHTQSRFLREVFDLWLAEDDPEVCIREFDSILRRLIGGKHTSCVLAGGCIGKYFAIDPDGSIFHCDEFMFDQNYNLGNIQTTDFQALQSADKIQYLNRENSENIRTLDCPWVSVCNGGCPKDRYINRIFGLTARCCGFADLIEHISLRLEEKPNLAKSLSLPPVKRDPSVKLVERN
ncbi:MAG TPA: radical SAM protein [Chthoniobacterales bacterium]|nr:radical SAM protein [Chthoniobacterales bacterium]